MRLELEQMVERLATVRRPWLIATARRAGAGRGRGGRRPGRARRGCRRAPALPRGRAQRRWRTRPRPCGAARSTSAARARRSRAAAGRRRTPPGRPRTTSGGARCGRSRRRSSRCRSGRGRCWCWTPPAGAAPHIARRLEVSERVVKRVLADHRGAVVATATAAVGGADCARLSATLATYAAGVGRPRVGRAGRPAPRGLRRLPPGARAGARPPRPVPAAVRVRRSAPRRRAGGAAGGAQARRGHRRRRSRPPVGVGVLAHRPAPRAPDPVRVAPDRRAGRAGDTAAPRHARAARRPARPHGGGRDAPRTAAGDAGGHRPPVAAPRGACRAAARRDRGAGARPAACDLGTLGICGPRRSSRSCATLPPWPSTIRESLDGVDWARAKADLRADDFDNGRSPEALRRVVRAVPARRHRPRRRPRGGDGPAALRRRLQRVPDRRLDGVEPPPTGDRRRRWCELLAERVPGQHIGLQTDDAEAFYASLGFQPQPAFMSRVVGRWLDNDANR